ncbi:MFS transporter [Duganella sp. HH105]|uniref:MFS transporter n=1 Tax=Duganella sp. HH105 TaxID=1781067 RepID=UPI001E2DE868|nr:MFS transporter [Duganella sp. HH105]
MNQKMPIAIYALAVGAFGIGTTEFIVMGLLMEMARDFNTSISGAGYIITVYALGVVLGAPLLTPFLSRLPRRPALIGLMALFTLGNAACALAGSFWQILLARLLTSFVHASYFGIGSVVAADLAPAGKKSSALSTMFLGATLANVIGVPLGTVIGQAYGWRSSFCAVTLVGLLATLATALFVPKLARPTAAPNLRAELRVLRQPDMLQAFAVTVLGFGGTFAAFTYIAPFLTQVTGLSEQYVSPMLVLFGLGMVVGNPIGGKLADRNTALALRWTLGALATVLLLLVPFAHNPYVVAALIFLFGAAMFATISPLQTQVLERGTGAPTLAAACNIAAFNLGNAGGAWVGGVVIASGLGISMVPAFGALITLAGLAVVFLYGRGNAVAANG